MAEDVAAHTAWAASDASDAPPSPRTALATPSRRARPGWHCVGCCVRATWRMGERAGTSMIPYRRHSWSWSGRASPPTRPCCPRGSTRSSDSPCLHGPAEQTRRWRGSQIPARKMATGLFHPYVLGGEYSCRCAAAARQQRAFNTLSSKHRAKA